MASHKHHWLGGSCDIIVVIDRSELGLKSFCWYFLIRSRECLQVTCRMGVSNLEEYPRD